MADAELVDYIKENLGKYGAGVVRAQLLKDGVAAEEINAALAEAGAKPLGTLDAPSKTGATGGAAATVPPKKKKLALFAVLGGGVLVALAAILSLEKPVPSEEKPAAPEDIADIGYNDTEGAVFRGHYGYMLKLPPKYETHKQFLDPQMTQERVYIYPKGTNSQHFINEGLYGPMGILRLDVTRRRVPQGFIGIETLKTWVKGKLDQNKTTYSLRETMVQSMPAFIVNIEKPFKGTKAYVIGQKVRYEVTAGEENTIFTSVLSSLYEASPHDRPGK